MAIRLTVDARRDIVSAAVSDKFDPIFKDLDQKENELIRKLVERFSDLELLKIARKLPRNWLQTSGNLWVNLGGWKVELKIRKGNDTDNFIPYSLGMRHIEPSLPAEDPLCIEGRKVVGDREKAEADKKEAYNKLAGFLWKIRTLEDLKKSWPEGEQYYSFIQKRVKPSLPVTVVEDINSMLGLPK